MGLALLVLAAMIGAIWWVVGRLTPVVVGGFYGAAMIKSDAVCSPKGSSRRHKDWVRGGIIILQACRRVRTGAGMQER